jgi:hypothetical protein
MRRFHLRVRPLFHRALACALVASLLAASVGVPVVDPRLNAQGKDVSQPFPCQHSSCGCQNAEACWRGCCCRSERQKLAWARENGVKPPAHVYAAAEKERRRESQKPCCDAKRSSSCCSAAEAPRPVNPWVDELSARKCQGLTQLWMVLSSALPTSNRAALSLWAAPCGAVRLHDELVLSLASAPATPPPKV